MVTIMLLLLQIRGSNVREPRDFIARKILMDNGSNFLVMGGDIIALLGMYEQIVIFPKSNGATDKITVVSYNGVSAVYFRGLTSPSAISGGTGHLLSASSSTWTCFWTGNAS